MSTQDVMSRMHTATRKAFSRVSQTAGIPIDPSLRLYKSLTKDDFQKIAQQFGADKTMDYIRTMEAKQMIGGKNA